MLTSHYFRVSFGLIVLIGILHLIGLHLFLYWPDGYYDILMHFLGGMWVGLTAVWLMFFYPVSRAHVFRANAVLATVVISLLVIGTGWEVFEYVYNVTMTGANYVADTTADYLMGMAGALCAAVYILWRETVR